jgi:hypothetical protein
MDDTTRLIARSIVRGLHDAQRTKARHPAEGLLVAHYDGKIAAFREALAAIAGAHYAGSVDELIATLEATEWITVR